VHDPDVEPPARPTLTVDLREHRVTYRASRSRPGRRTTCSASRSSRWRCWRPTPGKSSGWRTWP
jgi:hypothetical protein